MLPLLALALGRRWWPLFLLITTAVPLILLLAPDAYAAFGVIFDVTALVVLARTIARSRRLAVQRSR